MGIFIAIAVIVAIVAVVAILFVRRRPDASYSEGTDNPTYIDDSSAVAGAAGATVAPGTDPGPAEVGGKTELIDTGGGKVEAIDPSGGHDAGSHGDSGGGWGGDSGGGSSGGDSGGGGGNGGGGD